MARRCECRRLERLLEDPRLRTLPLAARGLLIMLAQVMARLPDPQVFAWGSRVGSVAELSMMVSAPETEVETHLETLVETRLLIRRAADGALMLPGEAPSSRAGIGGRPRTGETAEQARERRQGRLMLPIAGGGAETRETHAETSLARAKGCFSSEAEAASKPGAPEFVALGAELAELARLDPARGRYDFGIVKTWLAVPGVTAELLRRVIERVAARDSYVVPDRGLVYFDKPIRVAAAETASLPVAQAAPIDPQREAERRKFLMEMQRYQEFPHGEPPTPPAWLRAA